MSAENITKYLNGTSFHDDKNETVGVSFLQTVLLVLFVITSVILLSALAYYLVRKRALDKMRHHLVPLYHFDPGECDTWEDEILDEPFQRKPRVSHQEINSELRVWEGEKCIISKEDELAKAVKTQLLEKAGGVQTHKARKRFSVLLHWSIISVRYSAHKGLDTRYKIFKNPGAMCKEINAF